MGSRVCSLNADERSRVGLAWRQARWHYSANMPMLQALTAKWYGSHAEMFEFARSTSASGRPGGLTPPVKIRRRADLVTPGNGTVAPGRAAGAGGRY